MNLFQLSKTQKKTPTQLKSRQYIFSIRTWIIPNRRRGIPTVDEWVPIIPHCTEGGKPTNFRVVNTSAGRSP